MADPADVLFLSHVHQRHEATVDDKGWPQYYESVESELEELTERCALHDASWLGCYLMPSAGQNTFTLPTDLPDGFFRHDIPKGATIQIGKSAEAPAAKQLSQYCVLQIIGPWWQQVMENTWMPQTDLALMAEQPCVATHMSGTPIVLLQNRLLAPYSNTLEGCAILVENEYADALWETLMASGLFFGFKPSGILARTQYYAQA